MAKPLCNCAVGDVRIVRCKLCCLGGSGFPCRDPYLHAWQGYFVHYCLMSATQGAPPEIATIAVYPDGEQRCAATVDIVEGTRMHRGPNRVRTMKKLAKA